MDERSGVDSGSTPSRLAVGDRLPPLVSPAVPGGESVPWRSPARGAIVVVFLSESDGEVARSYLQELGRAAGDLQDWSARLLVVVGEARGRPAWPSLRAPVAVVTDPEGDAHRAVGVDRGEYAVVVADRWGQVYHISRAGSPTELATAPEIISWARFLATQCPECGVPDEPGGVE